MAEPKVVVAVGSCTCTGGVFRDMYNVEDGIDRYIPVDVYIPGCAASPELIMDGVVKALDILESKTQECEMPKRLAQDIEYKNGLENRRDMAQKIGEEDGKD